jgi:cytochrome c
MIASTKKLLILVFLICMGCDQKIDTTSNQETLQLFSNSKSEISLNVGDPERGRKLYFQCRACHSLKKNEPHKIGPNLFGVFNSKAGTRDGFIYSTALMNSNLIWDIDNLDHWLEKPYELVPGNQMIFSGMKNKNDRDDLLAYLYKETAE